MSYNVEKVIFHTEYQQRISTQNIYSTLTKKEKQPNGKKRAKDINRQSREEKIWMYSKPTEVSSASLIIREIQNKIKIVTLQFHTHQVGKNVNLTFQMLEGI